MTLRARLCYIGTVEITWLGHSCFRIKGNQAEIITDPFPPESGYNLGKPTARIVTVSHQHLSHNYVQGVGGDPKLVTTPGEYEISGVLIIGIASYHDAEGGRSRGRNTIYLMEVDGISVCHLGDLGQALTDEQAEEIDNADVLLMPVGGVSTMNAAAASAVVRQLEPKIVIPMHYQTPVLKRELEPVDNFLREMGMAEVAPQPKLSVTRSNLPAPTQVVVLDYKG